MATFSAYLSVYNDWEILPHTLESIRDYVSELVVVDGGYAWMSSYLQSTGKNPSESDPILYQILDNSGIPYRIVKQVWTNELEKRIAGYEATNTDYVFRVDADEVSFMSNDTIRNFVKDGGCVSEMDLPMYDSPGYVQWPSEKPQFPRQGFLFDRNQISAEEHLSYLWLILTVDKLSDKSLRKRAVYERPAAFNAHLSQWRSPSGGVQRASFYILNYLRQHGAPDRSGLSRGPIADFSEFFDVIPPRVFEDAMKRSDVINYQYKLDHDSLMRSPLSVSQESKFIHVYQNFLRQTREFNEQATLSEQGFLANQNLCFHRNQEDLGLPWNIDLLFNCEIDSAIARLYEISVDEPYTFQIDLEPKYVSTDLLRFSIPKTIQPRHLLRQIITISVQPKAPAWFGQFRIVELS